MKTREERWYVGAMNDCLFIINEPPRPSNDHINFDQDATVIAKVSDLGPEGDRQAALLAAAPELLAMLQQIRIALPVTLDRYRVGFCRDIDALLAKATGQEVGR